MDDDANSDAEVVLRLARKVLALNRLVAREDRIVIELDGPNIHTRGNPYIKAAADAERKARVVRLETVDADQRVQMLTAAAGLFGTVPDVGASGEVALFEALLL